MNEQTDLIRLALQFENMLKGMDTTAVQFSRWMALRAWLLIISVVQIASILICWLVGDRPWLAAAQIPVLLAMGVALYFVHRSLSLLTINIQAVAAALEKENEEHGETTEGR